MKNFSSALFLYYCLLAISCSPKPQSDYLVIDLVNHKSMPVEQIALSDISESIQIIPLATNDSVLIGPISTVKLEADKLYISASNGVFVFDIHGKFLNTVGTKGRGPKEYLYLYDIYPENDIIWLIDDSGKKALKYTGAGIFLESFDFYKLRFTDYYYSGADTFIGFVPDLGQSNTNIMLAFFSPTEMIDSVCYRNPMLKNGIMVMFYSSEITFVNYGNQIKFKHLFSDTLYHLLNNKPHPYAMLNLGQGKANENARNEAAHQDIKVVDLFKGMDRALLYGENESYIFLKVEDVPFFFDKKEQKAHKWEFVLPDDKRLDPEGVKKFIPQYIDKYGNLIGVTLPANSEDNPVIIIAKIK